MKNFIGILILCVLMYGVGAGLILALNDKFTDFIGILLITFAIASLITSLPSKDKNI